MFKIKLEKFSPTDYAYLINNQLGYIDEDDDKIEYYVFDSEEDMREFEKYLNLSSSEQFELVKNDKRINEEES